MKKTPCLRSAYSPKTPPGELKRSPRNFLETKKTPTLHEDRRFLVRSRRATELFLVPLALQQLPLLVLAHLLATLLDYTAHVFTSLILICRYIRCCTVFFAVSPQKHPKTNARLTKNRQRPGFVTPAAKGLLVPKRCIAGKMIRSPIHNRFVRRPRFTDSLSASQGVLRPAGQDLAHFGPETPRRDGDHALGGSSSSERSPSPGQENAYASEPQSPPTWPDAKLPSPVGFTSGTSLQSSMISRM